LFNLNTILAVLKMLYLLRHWALGASTRHRSDIGTTALRLHCDVAPSLVALSRASVSRTHVCSCTETQLGRQAGAAEKMQQDHLFEVPQDKRTRIMSNCHFFISLFLFLWIVPAQSQTKHSKRGKARNLSLLWWCLCGARQLGGGRKNKKIRLVTQRLLGRQ